MSLATSALAAAEGSLLDSEPTGRDEASYDLLVRNLPRLSDREIALRFASGELKASGQGVGGNAAVYIVQRPSSKRAAEEEILWMSLATWIPELRMHLRGDLVLDPANGDIYIVLVEADNWETDIRIHRLRVEEVQRVPLSVLDDPYRKDWPTLEEPIGQERLHLAGRRACRAKVVESLLVQPYIRIFIQSEGELEGCPLTEASFSLDTLTWKLRGETALQSAEAWTIRREDVGERLRICFLDRDENLETRLACVRRLGEMQYLPAIRTLVKHVEVEDPAGGEGLQRYPAAWALSQLGMAAVPEIVTYLIWFEESNSPRRETLLRILRQDKIRGKAELYIGGIVGDSTNERRRKLAEVLLEEL